jgi:hypothetical protein
MRLLFWLFGKAIHRYIDAGKLRPKGFDGMELAYTFEGVTYWTWVDITDMPPIRQKHFERCLNFANAAIGKSELNKLCDIADSHIATAIKATKPSDREKTIVRIAHIIGEIRNRPDEIIPEEVFYDIAALFVAREDEDPRTFDPSTHGQKVEMMTKAGRAGHTFFTEPPVLRRQVGYLLTTESAFTELLRSWTLRRVRMKAVTEAHGRKL